MLRIDMLHARGTRHTATGLCARARVWVWMLFSLMCLATLAPTLSRTLDHGKPMAERGWLEVCIAHGTAWVPAETEADAVQPEPRTQSAAADADLLLQGDACALCRLGIDRSTLPPDFAGWGLSLPLPTALPTLAGVGPGSHARLTAWARGPPHQR